MFLPLVLITTAVAAAAAMAFGTHPAWVQTGPGLSVIMISRQLQWPLAFLSLGLSLGLIGMVISGHRRAWWLIGLAPVLALFMQRFALSSANRLAVWDDPIFVVAENATFLLPDDWVVGLEFNGQTYAYSYATLYRTPVIVQADRDKRLMLLWSAQANRATAWEIARDVHSRSLEAVATPAGALLVYHGWLGQFINGLTGLTPRGEKPGGFDSAIATTRTTWGRWRALHPRTRVMMPPDPRITQPAGPLVPPADLPALADSPVPPATPILFVATPQPLAILPEDLDDGPLNVMAGEVPVLIFRDGQGVIRALDRRVEIDLLPRFIVNDDPLRQGDFIDVDTGTGWTMDGLAVDGDRQGQRLVSIAVEPDLYWGVMKFWYPDLMLHQAELPPVAAAGP